MLGAPGRAAREPRRRARPRRHAPGVGRAPVGRGRRGVRVHAATDAADDLRAIGRIAARRRTARSSSPTATWSRSARCSPGCSPTRASRPAILTTAADRRGRSLRARARARAAIVSAGVALPRRAPPDRRRSSACSRSRPPTAPASPTVAERLAALLEAPAAARVAGGARRQGASAGAAWLALSRRSCGRGGEPAPPREERDAARAVARGRAPSSSAGSRDAPDDVTALLLVGLVRVRRARSALTRLRALFWARPLSQAALRARARADPATTTRSASCSTRRSRARTASSRRSSSRPYSKYIARWCARRGLTPNQVTIALDRGRRAGRRRRSRPASAPGWWPARCCSRSRSRSTASTASSPATRASSPSSAPGWTRSSTARRSTSCSPGWRSARAGRATRCGCWRAPRSTLQTARHAVDFSYPALRSTR